MKSITQLAKHLRPGKVYRRAELSQWSNSVDRHAAELVLEGKLKKLSHGMYLCSKSSSFGDVPASDHELVHSFLRSDKFLLVTPNAYNSLGIGTTQLYNTRVVYNHKRHGPIEVGGRKFEFRMRSGFPKSLSAEFLVVELLNNLGFIEEDSALVTERLGRESQTLDRNKLRRISRDFGKVRTRKIVEAFTSSAN
ncbi:MAG: hypothetical protein V3W41_11745 [Planctomycetota bacterium]